MAKRITHYSRFQYLYGLYSILIALEYFESIEDYTECHCIIKGIERNEKELKCKFPKRIEYSDFDSLSPTQRTIQKQNANKLIEYRF
ncbi:TPA: hypothetical protein ACG0AB_000769 [Elizabethkingia anophelis]